VVWKLHPVVCRILGSESNAMKAHNSDVMIQRLDERRFAVTVDGVVRYVGSEEECGRRAAILTPKSDRAAQDEALVHVARSGY
jgi:hypothetical protein